MTATAAPTAAPSLSWLRYPVSRQFGRDLGYLAVTGVMSILSFTVFVTGLSVTASLIVFVIGFLVAFGWFWANRGLAELERRRAAWVVGAPIAAAYRRPADTGLAALVKTQFRDPQTWRDLLWTIFDSTVGFVLGVVAVSVWASWLGTLLLPAWWWSMPDDAQLYGIWTGTSTGSTFLGPAVALVALLPLAWLTRGMALLHAGVSRMLLRPTGNARVEQLTESRAGAVDAAHAELQRIERDLHDGAQARLVALAMDLGMAEQKVAEDPDASRELIGEAREETLRALGDLRELVRGIGPSILRDRGLDAAITSLTTGRAQPVDVRVDVGSPRPSDVQEAAAYFVVSEALANAAKHSNASLVRVRIWRSARDRIVVEVTDDGDGGADPAAGSGLRGLIGRVAAIDGELTITSPRGGPTKLHAEIPCGS